MADEWVQPPEKPPVQSEADLALAPVFKPGQPPHVVDVTIMMDVPIESNKFDATALRDSEFMMMHGLGVADHVEPFECAQAKSKAAKRKTSAPGAAVAKLQVCVLCAVHGETEKCECRGPDCPDGQAGGTAYDEDEAAVRDGTGPVHHHRVTCSRSHPRSTHR